MQCNDRTTNAPPWKGEDMKNKFESKRYSESMEWNTDAEEVADVYKITSDSSHSILLYPEAEAQY